MGYTSGSVTNVTLHEIEYRKEKTYCITVGFVTAAGFEPATLRAEI